MAQLLLSMRQKSPELEIPEGIFYDGIPNTNLYVQKKDMKTGKLYGIMIYRMTESYEDAAIILADSGMLQSTEEKKHLVMSLWSGEWFENMRSQELAGSASVPYRRETFSTKKIILDFDADFNLADARRSGKRPGQGPGADQPRHRLAQRGVRQHRPRPSMTMPQGIYYEPPSHRAQQGRLAEGPEEGPGKDNQHSTPSILKLDA